MSRGGRPTDEVAAEHAEAAYRLHLLGKSTREIARQLGFASHTAAQKALARAFREHHPGPPEAERSLENDRYTDLLDRLYTMLDTAKEPLFVMDRILKVQAQRATLLGLNKPVVVEDDLGDQLASLIKRVAGRYQALGEEPAEPDAQGEDA